SVVAATSNRDLEPQNTSPLTPPSGIASVGAPKCSEPFVLPSSSMRSSMLNTPTPNSPNSAASAAAAAAAASSFLPTFQTALANAAAAAAAMQQQNPHQFGQIFGLNYFNQLIQPPQLSGGSPVGHHHGSGGHSSHGHSNPTCSNSTPI